jgi:hypothetical protein
MKKELQKKSRKALKKTPRFYRRNQNQESRKKYRSLGRR